MFLKTIANLIGIKGDFQHLFFRNEFLELTGKSRKGIIALTVILTLTLLALGFAIGGIKYLEHRMDDPFTNWVNLPIKSSYIEKVFDITDEFSKDSVRQAYNLDRINEYNIEFFGFINKETAEKYMWKTRTITPEGSLLRAIVNEKSGNVISGLTSKDGEEFEFPRCQIIIKADALRDLGYTDLGSIKRIPLLIDDIKVYPEVAAIVKELPNMCQAVVTSHFGNLLTMDFNTTNFINFNASNQLLFTGLMEDKEGLADIIKNKLTSAKVIDVEFDKLHLSADHFDTRAKVFLTEWYDGYYMDTILMEINELVQPRKKFEKYVIWECNVGDFSDIESPHYLSFNFTELTKVRDFSEILRENYGVEISMDQVESKENFAVVSTLTSSIAAILLGFSILSIVFYVNSLLRTHLEKIKMNLGTFKAFGLNNHILISSYTKIILSFIMISIIFAVLICGIYYLVEPLILKNNYFDIFNLKVLGALIVIVLIAVFTSRRTISKTLMKTPGDLIYNR